MIGTVLDETYRVLERLGAGAMGEVFLVDHLPTGRREAIKVLRGELAADPRLAARFRREARAISRLRHPNIVGIHDAGALPDGRLYLTMEYARGVGLDEVVRAERRLPVARALHVLHQLAGAIDHAHAQGVVHRDLKPSNLVVVAEHGKADVLKVLDFGLAKVFGGDVDEVTVRGELVGTPEYLAPERMAGGADDARSDLYAIGCIAHELLTGAPPFTGARHVVMAAHLQAPPPSPSGAAPDLPPQLDAIVTCLLAKDPAARFQSARQLAAALERVPGFTRRPAPARGLAFADTANAAGDDVRDEIYGALVELARQALAETRADDDLGAAYAEVSSLRADRARAATDRDELEARQVGALQASREREGLLRFAISELRHDRQGALRAGAPPGDLDFQLAELDARVREIDAELRAELSILGDRAATLAAAERALDARWVAAHRRVRAALARRVATGPLAPRLAAIEGAIDQLPA